MDGVNVGFDLPHPLILQGFGGVAPKVYFATTYILPLQKTRISLQQNLLHYQYIAMMQTSVYSLDN